MFNKVTSATETEHAEIMGTLKEHQSKLNEIVILSRADPAEANKQVEIWSVEVSSLLDHELLADKGDWEPVLAAVKSNLPDYRDFTAGPAEAIYRIAYGEPSAEERWKESCTAKFSNLDLRYREFLKGLEQKRPFYKKRRLEIRDLVLNPVFVGWTSLTILFAIALCVSDHIAGFLSQYKLQVLICMVFGCITGAKLDSENRSSWIVGGSLTIAATFVISLS